MGRGGGRRRQRANTKVGNPDFAVLKDCGNAVQEVSVAVVLVDRLIATYCDTLDHQDLLLAAQAEAGVEAQHRLQMIRYAATRWNSRVSVFLRVLQLDPYGNNLRGRISHYAAE